MVDAKGGTKPIKPHIQTREVSQPANPAPHFAVTGHPSFLPPLPHPTLSDPPSPYPFASISRPPLPHPPAPLPFFPLQVGDTMLHVVRVEPSDWERGMQERRLALTVDEHGTVLQASDSPMALFGFSAATVVGNNIAR